MARFVALPVLVDAHQFNGGPLPDKFVSALRRHLVSGGIEVITDAGPRNCMPSDWLVTNPDGTFSVMSDAKFERTFAVFVPTVPQPTALPPAPVVVPAVVAAAVAKRPYHRKDKTHG